MYNVTFEACQSLESGPGFRRLSLMQGIEFNDLPRVCANDQEVCRAVAIAVVEKELGLILSGHQFDCDRHGNQLRVDSQGSDIHLGLYDFGEMSLMPLTSEELYSLARLVRELPEVLKKGGSVDALFQKDIQQAINNN